MLRLFSAFRLLPFALALACAPLLHAADYEPAATAKIDWTPNVSTGVGVPGGIPARATISSTLTATGDMTDRKNDIYNALYLAAVKNTTVQLGRGKFYVSDRTYNYGINNMTLRGFGTEPAEAGADPSTGGTEIISLAGGNGFVIGGSVPGGASGTITGTPTKGDTTLSITNAAGIIVGSLLEISVQNDETLPTMGLGGIDFLRVQTVLVTGVNVGAGTFTFQPALYQTPVKRTGGSLLMQWGQHQFGVSSVVNVSGFGLEDLTVDTSATTTTNTVYMYGAHGSWVKNVRITGVDRYGLHVADSLQCEFREITIEPNTRVDWVSSSHAGMTLGKVSGSLFENNIVSKNFPLIEPQASISGNVFGYNFGLQIDPARVPFSYHSVGNFCNLWEGNSGTGWFIDGYFGSQADDVVYRNDWHGVIDGSAQPGYPIFMGRMSRRIEIVGNQLGRPGTTLNVRAGPKTAFNEGTVGNANNYAGDPHVDTLTTGVLTTRTNDTSGVVTLDTTLGSLALGSPYVDDINVIGIQWGSGYTYSWASASRGAINTGALTLGISSVSATLPAASTAVRLFYGVNAFLEWDDAVLASTVLLGNYYYSELAIPSGQALGSTTLPASLYRSTAPAFMSGYNWPPFDPVTPDPRYAAIPAGARYEGGGGATSTLSGQTLNTTNVNKVP